MKVSRSGLLALFVVYFVWGSSFLAIRLAVTGSGAFAPYSLAAIRTLSAGILLLACALGQGHSLKIGWASLRWLALTGILLWVGGHALVIWAERRIDSSLAALIFASTPLWAALIESVRRSEWRMAKLLPIFVGFLGVALVLPLEGFTLSGGLWVDGVVLLFSAFLWSLGTVLGAGPARGLPILLSTGIQLSVAGFITVLIAVMAGESLSMPGGRALSACVYLIAFGTVLAYVAYSHAQRTLPISWLMSFGYVNPMVAVVLGAIVLGEKFAARSLVGMGIVLGSLIWIFAGPALTEFFSRKMRNAS